MRTGLSNFTRRAFRFQRRDRADGDARVGSVIHADARQGIALVITLILLSVITFMAITFLVVSRSEQGQVHTETDQTIAKLAAESGMAEAQLNLLTPMMVYTNEYNFDMLVSTNYSNPFGFVAGVVNPTNVNYEYLGPTHAALAPADRLQNIANLMFSPRVPVYMTNRVTRSNDFNFYYDANRNGRYDTNGWQPVISNDPTRPFYDTNGNLMANIIFGNTASNNFTGDPEWIGMLERPWLPHSGTNRFGARFCYIVIPVGKTLDINYIHNYSRMINVNMNNGAGDGFIRNQGAATWEINLASFLSDLNTNMWPPMNLTTPSPFGARYFYNTNSSPFGVPAFGANSGVAFDDALSVLRYRYNANYRFNLWNVNALFGGASAAILTNNVDNYSHGPFMFGTWYRTDGDSTVAGQGWAGSDNPRQIFTPQEFFDKGKINNTGGQLTLGDRLNIAGTNNDSYNRYTFYRMLSQLGTESAPEPASKMNLNFDNLVQANPITGVRSATNFIPWRPIDFFTNAAIRLLGSQGYGTNIISNGKFQIQIYPTNYYSPSVHRMLQVAANLYDATTYREVPKTAGATNYMGLPSVFRPVFAVGSPGKGGVDQIFINGFEEVTNTSIAVVGTAPTFRDLSNPDDRAAMSSHNMIYGIPLVVGAKKGLPNFNELALQTQMYVTRKLEFRRPAGGAVSQTNQMYIVGVSNVFAMEAWNSYSNLLGRDLQMQIATDVTMQFSNELGVLVSNRFTQGVTTNFNFWPGFMANGAFRVPLSNTVSFLPTSTYRQSPPGFVPLTHTFEQGKGFEVPHWWVTMSTRTRYILIDTKGDPSAPGPRIVDYVNLNASEDPVDITAKMMEGGDCSAPNGAPGSLWCTNRLGNSASINAATYGIMNQVHVGDGSVTPSANEWVFFNMDPVAGQNVNKAIAGFKYNLYGIQTPGYGPYFTSNVFYAPFNPWRQIYQHTTWQANDPLVHYMVGDLTNLEKTNNVDFVPLNPPLQNIGRVNDRYEPWTTTLQGHSSSTTLFDLSVKDPGVGRSDDWEFPTNKLPHVGWIGRIHRGTPWQTIYLKAPVAQFNQWQKWTGNGVVLTNWNDSGTTNFDAEFSQPYRDRYIVDLFTGAVNENAGRGQLSVNQTNLAAWSAILGDVIALTNVVSDADLNANPFLVTSNSPYFIEPAGIYDNQNQITLPPIVRILAGINKTRASTNLFPKQVFTHMGDILAVPELTIESAFMNPTNYVGTYPNGHWTGVSPFMNLGNPSTLKVNSRNPSDHVTTQQIRALNDAAYERLPQQILGLLRLDQAPRFVIYSFGQALKPAEHSVVLNNGPFFLMCTNYQVSAEVATRAVVRIEGAPTKPHVVVEKFNVLPPD